MRWNFVHLEQNRLRALTCDCRSFVLPRTKQRITMRWNSAPRERE